MSLIATDEHLADMVFDLSDAFRTFSTEAAKLGALLEGPKNLLRLNGSMSYRNSALLKSRLLRNT